MILPFIKSKLSSSFGKDAVWTLFGQLAIMLCMLIINKIISNDFSVAEFGRYNIIRRSTSVLTYVILGGMGITLPRYLAMALLKRRAKVVKLTIFSSLAYIASVCAFTLLIYIVCKPYICRVVTGDDRWDEYMVIFCYSLICCLASYLVAYYRGLDRFKDFNLVQIVLQVSLLIPLMFTMDNVIEIFLWWTGIQLFLLILFFAKELLCFRKILSISIPLKKYIDKTRELSTYSIPRLWGDLLLFAMSAFPLIYIGEKMSLVDASFFSVSITLFTLTTPIFSFMGVILLPYIARFVADDKMDEAKKFINKLLKYYLILAVTVNVIMFFCMKLMILIFFSADYYEALLPSRIVSFALIPAALYYLYRNPIDAVSVKPYNTYILLVCFILLVIGFAFATNLNQFACAYLGVYTFLGFASWIAWELVTKKESHVGNL